MLPSISETNTLFGVSYCTVWRWTLRRKGIEYLTNSEGKCLLVYSSFPALTTAVVLGSLYCFWLGLGHTSLTFQRDTQSKQRRGVLWRHWPRLCSHLISCLLTSCDQSDYWNNKYHCWHKMDVACPAGWRKTVAYLPCSFWGLAWTLQWLIAVFLWEAGNVGTQEALFSLQSRMRTHGLPMCDWWKSGSTEHCTPCGTGWWRGAEWRVSRGRTGDHCPLLLFVCLCRPSVKHGWIKESRCSYH